MMKLPDVEKPSANILVIVAKVCGKVNDWGILLLDQPFYFKIVHFFVH
jgi:hypothetical protein